MFGLFNKKLERRVIGIDNQYSISFLGCSFRWYELPALKLLIAKHSKTLDLVFGLPNSYGEVKTDVVARSYLLPANEETNAAFNKILLATNSVVGADDVEKTKEHLVGFLRSLTTSELGDIIEFLKIDDRYCGVNFYRIEHQQMEDNSYIETAFILGPKSLLTFELRLTSNEEPKKEQIREDFRRIVFSTKFA